MEHMNDNGPRPDEAWSAETSYDVPPPKRHYRRSSVLPVVLAFIAGCMFASIGWSAIAGLAVFRSSSFATSTVQSVVMESPTATVAVFETQARPVTTLTPITSRSSFNVLDVNRLDIQNRNGSVFLNVHDSPYIHLNVAATLRDGVLSVVNRNQQVRVYVPQDELNAIINEIRINGRNGSVHIRGNSYENSFLADSLIIETRNGGVFISNIAVTDSLDLETRNANIHLTNVLAPVDGVNFTTRNGRVFAMTE